MTTEPPPDAGDQGALAQSRAITELTELTQALVRARGENPGGSEQQTVDVLADACRRRGMEVVLQPVAPGRPNLVATLEPAHRKVVPGPQGNAERPTEPHGILFFGHSDVVPAGSGWRLDPFEAVVEDGRIVGRGSADMKGGLAAVLVAIDAVRAKGLTLAGPVTLACTVDEEDLGLGVRALVGVGSSEDAGGPDGFTGLDGSAYAGCVVAEPTDLDVVRACRGDAYLELHVTGVPAHSGRPSDGRNAIDALSLVLAVIRDDHARLGTGADSEIGAGTWSVGRVEGGVSTSVVAADAHAWVDRRLLPGEDAELILTALLERVEQAGVTGDGITVTGRVTMQMPGFRTAADHPFVQTAVAAGRSLGLEAPVTGWTAACDGGFVDRDLGIPTIVLGPGSINDQAHQVDESVEVQQLVSAVRWYSALIEAVCTMDGQ